VRLVSFQLKSADDDAHWVYGRSFGLKAPLPIPTFQARNA
jgi:hypothetical protein